jgi:predicted enzyme related to lactoylglutathione lyase
MGNRVAYFEVGSRDHQALVGFYRELFGWRLNEISDGYTMIDTQAGAASFSYGPEANYADAIVYVFNRDLGEGIITTARPDGRRRARRRHRAIG